MPKIDDEQRRKEAEARAIEIANHEELLRKNASAETLAPKKYAKEKTEKKFAPLPSAHGKDWNKLLAAYNEKYGPSPDKQGALVFPTMEDAVDFFTAQAKAGLGFFATQLEDGKFIDYHVFSCKDGQLYQGTYAEIKKQLEEACKANPENELTSEGLKLFKTLMPATPEPNPAADMRARMKGHRDNETQSVDATTSTPSVTTRR